ncbi:hypothetical protein [Sorangium sp. So ce1000]|jgi:hypothetical protein|uniref:hypothetical protein n=1 Tax=Sorangium sp. So ce1000 TaxID=3133325 RepID=UPI003F632BBD
MQEPFRTLYFTLMPNNFPLGRWRYNVRFDNDRVLIGNDYHHITVLSGLAGWHVTIGGQHAGQVAGGFDDLVGLAWDVTPEIKQALDWFKDNRTRM